MLKRKLSGFPANTIGYYVSGLYPFFMSKLKSFDATFPYTWPVARQFCSAFFVLNWSIETRRSLIDYSFRILTNANILFSILKSLKTTFLKRSLIGCDVKLTSQDKVTWQLYQPISSNGLCQYRMASTFYWYFFLIFRYSRYLVSSGRRIPASNCTQKLQQNTSQVKKNLQGVSERMIFLNRQ